MGLETGNYISDLVPTNPLGTDARNQGDDHIRLIKQVILSTFPNIDGAVNATPAELNKLTDASNLVPEGTILMWAGAISAIPTGYQLCNGSGTTSTLLIPVPNLTSRFVVHADADSGGTYNPGNTGGSGTAMSGLSVDNHTLTESQMPSHTHQGYYRGRFERNGGATGAVVPNGSAANGGDTDTVANSTTGTLTAATGGGTGHNHGLTGTGNSTLPPYYALAYIIKL